MVYKARDPELERIVALKTVRPDLALPPAARERFHQEARAAGRLSHPGIVAVHDVIDVAGTPCLVLEYVEGRTLADLVAASGALPPREAVALAASSLTRLSYFFPDAAAPPPGGRRPESSRGAPETPRGVREALDEALDAPRKALEKLRETLGGGGGSAAPQARAAARALGLGAMRRRGRGAGLARPLLSAPRVWYARGEAW